MIEVEKIALLENETYHGQLLDRLASLKAKDLGENNTESIFYLGGNYHLKVSKLTSKNKAKIALKQSQYGDEFSHEFEVHFAAEDAASAEKIMDVLLADKPKVPTTQKRHDFLLDTVEIAVKYSDDWGYHVELEKLVESEADIALALNEIKSIAEKLFISVLSKEEAAAHIKRELVKRGINEEN